MNLWIFLHSNIQWWPV